MYIEKKEYKILLFILIILLIICAFTPKETFGDQETERDYNYFIKQLEENKNVTYRSLLIDDMLDKSKKQTDIKNKINKKMDSIGLKIEKLMTPNNIYSGNNTEKYQYIKNNQHYK